MIMNEYDYDSDNDNDNENYYDNDNDNDKNPLETIRTGTKLVSQATLFLPEQCHFDFF